MNLVRLYLGWIALAMSFFVQNAAAQQDKEPYKREITRERAPLKNNTLHERDVAWEKRVWQTIDLRSKRNEVFRDEKTPLINIIREAAEQGRIALYRPTDDEFKSRIPVGEVEDIFLTYDTIFTFDPVTFEEQISVIPQELNKHNVQKYRIKEVWYTDRMSGKMEVRILGIAPLMIHYDDEGNVYKETPIFWIYYPEARKEFAKHEAYNVDNEAARMSWEDIFEARMFESYITKQSNALDKRVQDYKSGRDAMLEAEKIKQEMFNREQDMWEY